MRILAYVEAQPIRNSLMQFAHVGRILAQGLASAALWEELEFRIFANHPVADYLASELPEVIPWLLRPTPHEVAALQQHDQTWNEEAIEVWLEVVHGRGRVSAIHADMLRRIHGEFAFDVVLLWSDNGAIAQAARALGATAVHAELGPTRPPFPPTIYLDGRGTNGNASVTRVPLTVFERGQVVPRETWLTPSQSSGGSPSVQDAGVLWPSAPMAALLPREPFVFIPLQFADDLNTLCHSDYRSPAAFLEGVIPEYLDRGLRVVIKGHPGVAQRPYNLAMEMRALARARTMGEGVVVVPRAIGSYDTLAAVAQAQAVCTINSSLGFESLLMGKNVSLVGAAAYDVHGRIRARGLRTSQSEEHERWDMTLVSFLMGHYLLPVDDVLSGEALLGAIKLIRVEHLRQGDFGEAFWSEWLQHMRFGWRTLVEGEPGAEVVRRSHAVSTRVWANVIDGDMLWTGDRVDVRIRSLSSTSVVPLMRVHAQFVGSIDALEWEGNRCRIRGWAFNHAQGCRAVALLVTSAEAIVACVPISHERADVAASLGIAAAAHSGFDQTFCAESPRSTPRLFLVSERGAIQEVAAGPGALRE